MGLVLESNGFGGEVGLDWGGIGLELDAERGGTCREDGAGVNTVYLKLFFKTITY